MQVAKLTAGAFAFTTAGIATAGIPAGNSLGATFGTFLGDVLPIAGSSVLLVAAATLGLGIYLARRKGR